MSPDSGENDSSKSVVVAETPISNSSNNHPEDGFRVVTTLDGVAVVCGGGTESGTTEDAPTTIEALARRSVKSTKKIVRFEDDTIDEVRKRSARRKGSMAVVGKKASFSVDSPGPDTMQEEGVRGEEQRRECCFNGMLCGALMTMIEQCKDWAYQCHSGLFVCLFSEKNNF